MTQRAPRALPTPPGWLFARAFGRLDGPKQTAELPQLNVDEDELEAEAGSDESSVERSALRRTCADCNASAPSTHTAHTLISSKHGWRVRKLDEAAGRAALEWRCPQCWETFKVRAVAK